MDLFSLLLYRLCTVVLLIFLMVEFKSLECLKWERTYVCADGFQKIPTLSSELTFFKY